MRRKAVLAALLLLLAACDKDRLPDDLTQSEGNAVAEEANVAEEPAAANVVAAEPSPEQNVAEPKEEAEDPLAPVDSNPSFDCAAASGRVERHICNVPELGALDRRIAEAFDRALDSATTDQADRLRNLGRQYLADRNRCRDDYCIRQAYRWYERDIYNLMGWQGPD